MNREELLAKLEEIFRDIFDDESIVLSEDTTPEDIEDWDSLGQVYLIAEIEDEFKIDLGESMQKVDNVAQVIDIIIGHMC